jgi:hypothetical protein
LAAAAEATRSIALSALTMFAAIANALLQSPLIASFLSFAYFFFKQQRSDLPTKRNFRFPWTDAASGGKK